MPESDLLDLEPRRQRTHAYRRLTVGRPPRAEFDCVSTDYETPTGSFTIEFATHLERPVFNVCDLPREHPAADPPAADPTDDLHIPLTNVHLINSVDLPLVDVGDCFVVFDTGLDVDSRGDPRLKSPGEAINTADAIAATLDADRDDITAVSTKSVFTGALDAARNLFSRVTL